MSSFFQKLKQIESFLTHVADTISPDYPAAAGKETAQHRTTTSVSTTFPSVGSLPATSSIHVNSNGTNAAVSSLFEPKKGDVDDVNKTSTPIIAPADTILSSMPPLAPPFPPNCKSRLEYKTYYEKSLQNYRREIMTNILPSIPLYLRNDFLMSLKQDLNAQVQLRQAQNDLAQKQQCQEDTFAAEKHVEEAKCLNQHSEAELVLAGTSLLSFIHSHLQDKEDTKLDTTNGESFCPQQLQWKITLMRCCILTNATPHQLATYSVSSKRNADHVYNLLCDPNLMKEILISDGPKYFRYTSMLQIYHSILASSSLSSVTSIHDNDEKKNNNNFTTIKTNDIFHRLALAIALEHAAPIEIFDTQITIDPIKRYHHYEMAYLNGELDESFSTLSTWELRMVVNNDASDNEIQWCRDMIRNYRPDHILHQNDQWRYCNIVRSDVVYKAPAWIGNGCPRSYQQLISGGGKCGPRAWMGRFACKSFGIPTWGVRQPDHAAMSHWTKSGEWVICLGGPNWMKSYWEDRNGVDFELETRARTFCGIGRHSGYNEEKDAYNYGEYEKNVFWLQCIVEIHQEVQIGSQNGNYLQRPVDERLWSELVLLQKKILARYVTEKNVQRDGMSLHCNTKRNLANIIQERADIEENCSFRDDGTIIIPASLCRNLRQNGQNVIQTKCFLPEGGNQIHVRGNACLEYTVNVPTTSLYTLRARIVTVHARQNTLQVKVRDGSLPFFASGNGMNYELEIPYTKGYWEMTRPITVELCQGINTVFFRSSENGSMTIKDFTLESI
mmetsp:Transcript_12475/g.18480  ORF Transcript_12475/g.18480 Transcript_12475/m.18480 type:complete len:783 (+) Transcript_12475:203-2551(+)